MCVWCGCLLGFLGLVCGWVKGFFWLVVVWFWLLVFFSFPEISNVVWELLIGVAAVIVAGANVL